MNQNQQQEVVPDVWFDDEDVHKFNQVANKVNRAKIELALAEAELDEVRVHFETTYNILRARDQWNIAGGFAMVYKVPECDKSGRPVKPKEGPVEVPRGQSPSTAVSK